MAYFELRFRRKTGIRWIDPDRDPAKGKMSGTSLISRKKHFAVAGVTRLGNRCCPCPNHLLVFYSMYTTRCIHTSPSRSPCSTPNEAASPPRTQKTATSHLISSDVETRSPLDQKDQRKITFRRREI